MSKSPSNMKTVTFVVILCLVCALILAILATSLAPQQERAKQLDTAKQILSAARIYNPKGYLQMLQDGEYVPAKWEGGKLVPGTTDDKATAADIYAVSGALLKPMFTNDKGDLQTPKEAGIDLQTYIADNQKTGYAQLPNKLLYLIVSGDDASKVNGYIIPVNGYGLWGPIYGYLALEPNADTIIGISWYAPAETPGLGAIIQDPSWQEQFKGKQVFLPSATGTTDFATSALGIVVVKGKVADIFGDSPRAETAVDGITGATLTGDGVTAAYASSLAPYRPFLENAAKEGETK